MQYSSKQFATVLLEACEREPDQITQISQAFIRLLVEKQAIDQVRDVAQSIEQLWKERYGAATVWMTSAHPLSQKARAELLKHIAGAELHEQVNPGLIGGASLRIDDRIIDGSIAGQLAALKSQLQTS